MTRYASDYAKLERWYVLAWFLSRVTVLMVGMGWGLGLFYLLAEDPDAAARVFSAAVYTGCSGVVTGLAWLVMAFTVLNDERNQ